MKNCAEGTCVDVTIDSEEDVIWVHDEHGNECQYTCAEWSEFIQGVKAGKFDLPKKENSMSSGVENGEAVLGSLPSLDNIEDFVAGGGSAEPLGTLPNLEDIEDFVTGGEA